MASPQGSIAVTTTSPKEGKGDQVSSPRGGGGQCLCSPTTHEGSFRCRFHRSAGTTTGAWFKRSKSMPPQNKPSSLSPKSADVNQHVN
ncbi:hypothetical protein NMG60_11013388 [Bertholletia excelsa]